MIIGWNKSKLFIIFVILVSKKSAIYKHMAGRYLNIPQMYPNRALQGIVSDGVTRNDLQTYHLKTSTVTINEATTDLSEEVKYFNKNIRLSLTSVVDIAIETQEQNTNLWKIHRSKRVTASSAYNLFTYLSNKNPDCDKKKFRSIGISKH